MLSVRRTIGCVLVLAACGGRATAPATIAAPPAPVTDAPPPVVAAEPAPVAPPTPAVVEPAPPPCPEDRRDPYQKPAHVLALAEVAPGMTVVDLGAGRGYFACHLSRAVGATGRVIATEVSKPLVRRLQKRVEKEQLANVEVIRAPTNDVGIEAGTADRILVVHVWHHLRDRKRYAKRVARALAPGGKIVVVDFKRASKKSTHGMPPERIIAELAAGGIDAKLVDDELPDEYVIVGTVRGG